MGLLQKAVSASHGKGLLRKSLEILSDQGETSRSPLLTQDEVDRLLAAHHKKPAYKKSTWMEPAKVPLTWDEAGVTAPPQRGPLIDETEIHSTLSRERAVRHEAPAGAVAREPAGPSRASFDPTENIISEVFSIPQSVELPSRVFSVLVERLAISKGSFMLYDPVRTVYAPWASLGFDTTTMHRLRVPLDVCKSMSANGNGRPLKLADAQAIKPYERFFSSREFASISSLVLVPFIADDTILALLLFSEASPPYTTEDALLSGLERIAGAASPAIQKAREDVLRRRPNDAAPTFEEEVSRLLASPSMLKKNILFLSLSLEKCREEILLVNRFLDPFRLEEDVHYFLQCFAADLGRAIRIGMFSYVFAIQDLEKKDSDLFIHQLRAFLGSLFGEPEDGRAIYAPSILKARRFPEEGDSISELVSFFSS